MSEELKPCPCCGCKVIGAAEIKQAVSTYSVVECHDCGLKASSYESLADAIAKWNTRPAPAPATAVAGEQDHVARELAAAHAQNSEAIARRWKPDLVNKDAATGNPTNRYLFKEMCAYFGIELGVDRVDVAMRKIDAKANPPAAVAVPEGDALESAANVLQEAIVQNGGRPSEMAIDWVLLIMLAAAPASPVAAGGWVNGDVAPAEAGAYLCMVQAKGATIAYPRVVWWGYYEFIVDEAPTLSNGQSYNEDDAMVSGTGWHDEIEQFGGEYDFVTVTFNTPGDERIISYIPTKLLRQPLPPAPASNAGGGE